MPSFSAVKAATYTSISGQMGVGARGSGVMNLQAFLASNSWIYPQAIVSGYYGALTARAVAQFQIAYNLPPVGRVGPLTLATMNSVIAAGRGIDISAPIINTNVGLQRSNTSATITWSANEFARGKIYYSTTPLQLAEAVGSFTEPSIMGGALNMQSLTAQTNQSIILPNLQPSTTYYYMIVATDLSGNVSVLWPASFTTTP